MIIWVSQTIDWPNKCKQTSQHDYIINLCVNWLPHDGPKEETFFGSLHICLTRYPYYLIYIIIMMNHEKLTRQECLFLFIFHFFLFISFSLFYLITDSNYEFICGLIHLITGYNKERNKESISFVGFQLKLSFCFCPSLFVFLFNIKNPKMYLPFAKSIIKLSQE